MESTIIPIIINDKQEQIKKLLEQSFENKDLSLELLEIAKLGVETAIEKNEEEAEKWINMRLQDLKVNI